MLLVFFLCTQSFSSLEMHELQLTKQIMKQQFKSGDRFARKTDNY